MMLQQSQPLLTNDLWGFARLIIGLVLGNAPVYGLVIYFMRRGPDARIDSVERDVAGIGKKSDETKVAQERLDELFHELQRAMDLSIQDRRNMTGSIGELRGRMEGYEKQTIEQQRDTLTAIRSSAEAITGAVNGLALRVERMEASSNVVREICQSFDDLGDKIVNAMQRR